MKKLLTIAALAGLAYPTSAAATPMVHDTNNQAETSVSGHSGTKYPRKHNSTRALTGMTWKEVADRPCWFSGIFRDLADVSGKNEDTDIKPVCEKPGLVNYNASLEKASVGADYFVTGISVCTNNVRDTRKRRLKGIQLFASKVGSDPVRVTGTDVTAKAERTNCEVWHPRRSCPNGMVAYGYTVHEGDHGAYGISLLCTKLKHTGTLTRPK